MKYQFDEDPFRLTPLWSGMLDIYREFASICDRHGLRYYVTDANCIGALRHGGFVPWDDDFDVSMPRPDYEEFKRISTEELPGHLKFINWENAPELNKLYGKIQDARQEYVESVEKQVGMVLSNGIFIDIFPVDGYTENRFAAILNRSVFLLSRVVLRYKTTRFREQTVKGKVKWLLGLAFSWIFHGLKNDRDFLAYYDRCARRYPFGSTSLTGRASLINTVTLFYPLAAWGDPRWADYNGIKVPLPHDVDAVLEPEYPNYMTLPPEDRRRPGHSIGYHLPWWLGPTVGKCKKV